MKNIGQAETSLGQGSHPVIVASVPASVCCSISGRLMGWMKSVNSKDSFNRDVSDIIGHPSYSSSDLSNDICLLKLKESLEFTHFIQPINLPEIEQQTEAGTLATITGWGTLTKGGFSLPNVLHKVEIPVVSDDDCDSAYDSAGYGTIESMICAGLPEGGKDSCQGDSGGPFFLNDPESPTLIGIVSWGIGCARAGYPGVYTEVSYFIDWIQDTMSSY